jgi:hypothetical protein
VRPADDEGHRHPFGWVKNETARRRWTGDLRHLRARTGGANVPIVDLSRHGLEIAVKTAGIVLAVIVALAVLPVVAVPLLALAGLGIGIAMFAGSAALFALPLAIGAAILGVVGLAIRLVFGLIGLLFSIVGVVLAAVFSLLILPFALLPVLLPLLLVGALVWWMVRAARDSNSKPLPPSAAA